MQVNPYYEVKCKAKMEAEKGGKMGNVGRPDKLTDDLKQEVTRYKIRHEKCKSPEMREMLRFFLKNRIKKEIAESNSIWPEEKINDIVKKQLPGLSSIQKYLKEIKPNLKKEFPEDRPWTVASLKDNAIPPEALPHVLEAWFYTRSQGDYFSIHEAQWVSRLYPLFKDDVSKLTAAAFFYAEEERLTQISNVSFYGFDETKGVLNLYEKWKGIHFEQAESTNLLTDPIIIGPKGLSHAQLRYSNAGVKGRGLRHLRERHDLEQEYLQAGKPWPEDTYEQYKLVEQNKKDSKQKRGSK